MNKLRLRLFQFLLRLSPEQLLSEQVLTGRCETQGGLVLLQIVVEERVQQFDLVEKVGFISEIEKVLVVRRFCRIIDVLKRQSVWVVFLEFE